MEVASRPVSVSLFCAVLSVLIALGIVDAAANLVSAPTFWDLVSLLIGVLLIVSIRNIWKMLRRGIKQFALLQLIDLGAAFAAMASAEYGSGILVFYVLGAKAIAFALLGVLVLPHWKAFCAGGLAEPAAEDGGA